MDDDDDVETAAEVGFVPGGRAGANVIDQASAVSIERWRHLGRAKAAETGREVIADHGTDLLDVTLALDPGRLARYGPMRVEGSRRVDPAFIAFMTDLPRGDIYDPDDIDAGQERLARLGVFRSIRIEEAEAIAPDGSLPITVRVEDRRPRTIGAGATLSTIEGLGLQAFWTHRNLFGRAEQLRFEASIEGLGVTTDPVEYDYNLGVTFTKPGVYTPDTSFVTSLVARQLDLDDLPRDLAHRPGRASRSSSAASSPAISSPQVSRSRFEDDFGTRNFLTFGVVGSAQYDRRDDTLDPTRGYYLAAELYPFYEAEFGNVAARGTLEGRIYRPLRRRGPLRARRPRQGRQLRRRQHRREPAGPAVLRRRRRLGARLRLPLDRGRDGRATDGDTVVVGGRGLFETSGEFRARFGERFGGVAFVDAGHRERRIRACRATTSCAPAPGSACATSPASGRCAWTWRPRSTGGRTIPPSRSTSGSGRRFETDRGSLRPPSARGDRRARADDRRPRRQRLHRPLPGGAHLRPRPPDPR